MSTSNRNPIQQSDLRRQQKETLKLLRRSSCEPVAYAGLEYCSAKHCRRRGCSEICAFGTHRRRKEEHVRIHRLLSQLEGPSYEVRAFRPRWDCDFGKLREVNISAGRRLVHRVLDGFFDNTIVAVGTFKLRYHGDKWSCEIHLIVNGRSKEELEKAFLAVRTGASATVDPVKPQDLRRTIANVMNCDLSEAYLDLITPPDQRKECFSWLANLKVGALTLLYGCDESFSVKLKPPRAQKPKIKKKRRYPHWLAPYMFEFGKKWEGIDPLNRAQYTPRPKPDPHLRVLVRGPDYYDE